MLQVDTWYLLIGDEVSSYCNTKTQQMFVIYKMLQVDTW